VISLDDYYNQRFSKDYFNVCLTFDDGFANNYKYVFPLMNKYKVPVTFFITSIRDAGYDILWNDLLVLAQKYGPQKLRLFHQDFYKDKHGRYVSTENGRSLKDLLQAVNFDEKEEMINFFQQRIPADIKTKEEDFWLQMTEHEIRSLSASVLATIGSHGYYHNDLSQIPVNKVKDEMICSKKYLESITGKKINAIAFPYGNYTRDVVAAAKSAGFYQLLATDFRCPEDYSDIEMYERLTVNPYISLNNQITAIIRGKYE
jgi:peptidoglycan/xylan/chitin deacetylase (PgdA/CDA1 family)